MVIEREHGGWMAVSAANENLRIGVVGHDEDTVLQAFADAVARWMELCEAAERRDSRE